MVWLLAGACSNRTIVRKASGLGKQQRESVACPGRSALPTLVPMLELFLQILLTTLVVIDPLGAVPLFISITGDLGPEAKRATIRKAIVTAFIVLSTFILGGRFILRFFGISPGAFYIAGGILFFLIAIDMLFGQTKRVRSSSEEKGEEYSASIAVFPLAIPYISGPGMITTIIPI